MNGQKKKKQYSVLTYIIGDYEIVHEILEKDPDAEYLLVTDNPELRSDTWTVVYDPSLVNDRYSNWERVWRVRYNPFKYCTTDFCVRVDGSIRISRPLRVFVDELIAGGFDIGLVIHPARINFLEEYGVWIEMRNYPRADAERAIINMKYDGYDFDYKGMFELTMSVHRNTELNKRICDETFEYLKKCGNMFDVHRLDQTVFSFIMNTRYNHLNVLPIAEQVMYSSYMSWCYHGSDDVIREPVPEEKLSDNLFGYMFNEVVNCMKLI